MPSRSKRRLHGYLGRVAALACVAAASFGGSLLGCEETDGGTVVGGRDRVGGVPRVREEDPGPTLVATGASKEALQRLTEATCERRARCGRLDRSRREQPVEVPDEVRSRGFDRALEACAERRKMDLVSEINNDLCRSVDRQRLDRCVAAIEREGCHDALGKIRRVIACRVDAFCSQRSEGDRQ